MNQKKKNRKRIKKGAKWLDKNVPNWLDTVEINTLDLSSPCRCILGQVFAKNPESENEYRSVSGFDYIYEGYFRDYQEFTDTEDPSKDNWAADRGFDADYSVDYDYNVDDDYNALTLLWAEYINARKVLAKF